MQLVTQLALMGVAALSTGMLQFFNPPVRPLILQHVLFFLVYISF